MLQKIVSLLFCISIAFAYAAENQNVTFQEASFTTPEENVVMEAEAESLSIAQPMMTPPHTAVTMQPMQQLPPAQIQSLPSAPSEIFTLADTPDAQSTSIAPESLYQEAEHLYDQLCNQQLDLNKVVQQHMVQEQTLSDEIDTCAKNIGIKGGKIKGLSQQLKQYIEQKKNALAATIKEHPQDEGILRPIIVKIDALAQELLALTSGIATIDTHYKHIKDIQKQIKDTNQSIEQKELDYSAQVRMMSEYKARLLEEKTLDAHQAEILNIRNIAKVADLLFQEIKNTSFDRNGEIRTRMQTIDTQLQTLDQKLRTISSEIDGIMKMITDYETTTEKKLLASIKTATAEQAPTSSAEKDPFSLLKAIKNLFKNNKKLFWWVKGYARDVKEKMLYTKETALEEQKGAEHSTQAPPIAPVTAPIQIQQAPIAIQPTIEQKNVAPATVPKSTPLPVQQKITAPGEQVPAPITLHK